MNSTTHVVHSPNTVTVYSPRRIEPVLIWAVLGAFAFAFIASIFIRWVSGPDFVTNAYARELVPEWQRIWIRTVEVASALSFFACNYYFLYRPWRLTGEISSEGLLVLAAATMYWQDDLVNYTSYYSQLNTYFINFGNYVNYIPGWLTPNQERTPEAIVAWGFAYGSWFILIPTLLGSKILRYLHDRFPRMSRLEAIGCLLAFYVFLDFLNEGTIVWTGLYVFGGAVRSMSLWPGTLHQFPIYEFVTVGSMWTTITAVWYYRNDKGHMLIEHGIDRLTIGKKTQKLLRFLALTAFVNLVMVVQVGLPVNIIQLHADEFPADMPPYLIGGLCGDGNAYACPSQSLPIATRTAPTNRIVVEK
jgi:Spirocyclase AveC-like